MLYPVPLHRWAALRKQPKPVGGRNIASDAIEYQKSSPFPKPTKPTSAIRPRNIAPHTYPRTAKTTLFFSKVTPGETVVALFPCRFVHQYTVKTVITIRKIVMIFCIIQ